MIDLLAIDLDGTLLTNSKTITDRTRRAIKAVQAQDIKVIIATARPPRSVAKIYRYLELKDAIICYNGALLYDPISKTVISHSPIPLETAKDVVSFARLIWPDIIVSAEVLDEWFTEKLSEQYQTEVSKEFKPDKLGPINSWLTCDVTKLLLLGPEEKLSIVKSELKENFGKKISIAQNEGHLLQIMKAGISKGEGLRKICEYYNIPLKRTLAIGDNFNDLDMIAIAGLGAAMADAPEEVKKVADYITSSNEENGVAEVIERFVL